MPQKKLPKGDYYTVRWFEERVPPQVGFEMVDTLAPTVEDAEAIVTHLEEAGRKGIVVVPEMHKKAR